VETSGGIMKWRPKDRLGGPMDEMDGSV